MRLVLRLRSLAFIYISALIMVVGSERIFWYYGGADVWAFAELGAFYSLGTFALFWTMQRYQVTEFWSFFAAVAVFGYVIEGVITPILYEAGPLPFFPAYFTGWHGVLSVVVLWYGLRRLLIEDRWRATLATAVALGVLWGLQGITMWLPENLNDPALAESVPEIRSPLSFLRYAMQSSVVLIGGHWLLGRGLWTRSIGRSRVGEGFAAISIVALVAGWTILVPWAAPMFAALMGGVAWVLRRHRATSSGPTMLEQLDGPVSTRALATLIVMPLTAAAVYAGLFQLDPPETAVQTVMYGIVGIATIAGGGLTVVSWRKVLRRHKARQSMPAAPMPTVPESQTIGTAGTAG